MCSFQQNMKKPIVVIYHLLAINIQTKKKKNQSGTLWTEELPS